MSKAEDKPHPGRKDLIDDEEKAGCNKHHYEYHCRGDDRLLAGRPGNAGDFLADLFDELDWTRLRHT